LVSVLIKKSEINGAIRSPGSKSYSHRAIAIASLTSKQSIITNPLVARDTLATLAACKAVGTKIKYEDSALVIEGRHVLETPENIINTENSGTTLRLMTVMSALVKKGFTVLTGDESLRRRPMQPIINALEQLGVQSYSTKMNGTPPIIVRGGGIKGGSVTIDGTISSQFVSALLISCIYADSEVRIKIKGKQVSKPYIEATLSTMKAFGVTVEHQSDLLEYNIGSNEYKATVFDIPSDFSIAALILSAGVLAGKEIVLKGLDFRLPQADSQIVDIIRRMEGKIRVDKQKGQVTVCGTATLEGGHFDLFDTPDLLPVVSVLALKARSPVKISGVSHARLKETDRIAKLASEFIKLGVYIKEDNDGLLINAPKKLKNASLEAHDDHRLFMAFSIASLLTEKSTVIGAESVDVSYPNFIDDMRKLGADIKLMTERE
jgi:3-phosphoshikimate 1-carboxyvinyltransferase